MGFKLDLIYDPTMRDFSSSALSPRVIAAGWIAVKQSIVLHKEGHVDVCIGKREDRSSDTTLVMNDRGSF